MSNKPPDKIWKLLYNMMKSGNNDVLTILHTLDQVLLQKKGYDINFDCDELLPRSFVIWLFNQLLGYCGKKLSRRTQEQNTHLQKKLMIFCCAHMPRLFELLLTEYTKTLQLLLNTCYKDNNTLDTKCRSIAGFTCVEKEFFQSIDENFSSEMIDIPMERADITCRNIVEVLTSSIGVSFNVHVDLYKDILKLILELYLHADPYCKIECLMFSTEVFNSLFDLDDSLTEYYILLFEYCQLFFENINPWMKDDVLHDTDISKAVNTALHLIHCNYKTYFNSRIEEKLLQSLMKSCEAILHLIVEQQHLKEHHLDLKKHLIEFISQIHQKTGAFLVVESLIDLAKKDPEYVELFRTVCDKYQGMHLEKLLHCLKDVLVNAMKCHEICFPSVRHVLTTLIDIEHNAICDQQNRSFSITKEVKSILYPPKGVELPFPCQELNETISVFLRNLDRMNPTLSKFCDFVEVCGLLLHIESLKNELPADLTITLIDTILFYLRHILKIRQQKTFNISTMGQVDDNLFHCCWKALKDITINSIGSEVVTYLQISTKELLTVIYSSSGNSEIRRQVDEYLLDLIGNSIINRECILHQVLPALVRCATTRDDLARIKSISCFLLADVVIAKRRVEGCNKYEFLCDVCDSPDFSEILKTKYIMLKGYSPQRCVIDESALNFILNTLGNKLFNDKVGIFAINHFALSKVESVVLQNATLDPDLIKALVLRTQTAHSFPLLQQIAELILEKMYDSLQRTMDDQKKVLRLITILAYIDGIPELSLFHFFKMTFFYLICSESMIANEAARSATEMCAKYGVEPLQLWHWYKRECLNLVVNLVVHVYLTKGQGLLLSLNSLVTMLGFLCSQEFICKYYKILTAMILPFCVKDERCKGLLYQVSQITDNSISHILTTSFLNIYSHIYLCESPEIGNRCIDLLVTCTGSTLSTLMHADVRQTVSEFLIFYNRKPEFVKKAFSCLILNKTRESSGTSGVDDFAVFIAERFLGVITYFETCLSDPNFEKSLKEDVLYSLGQIIRLVGAEHVTQSRYKIIAMLTRIVSLDDKNLRAIGLKIWNIFLHIVDIISLGPSLSRVVVCLQPLLPTNRDEVESIYKFLVIENGNLLGPYLSDLYFIDEMDVPSKIKECVRRQIDALFKDGSFEDQLRFYCKQINNENLQVKTKAMKYLKTFFVKHRADVNNFITGQTELSPLIESIIEHLIKGCKHVDRMLQLSSAQCLGELGAIDPSYMPPNYAKEQKKFPLSIHTDSFAITALTELCKAYQKNIKYVDNISVAIQEILAIQGVNPKDNKKMNVWEAIPIRMRHIMEPLLSSCYSVTQKGYKIKSHPIFGSNFCRTYEDWAFWWSWKLVELVRDSDTKRLLCSFTPSIRKDNNMLALFLPYILVHALQECTDSELELIYEEFQAIFQQAVNSTNNSSTRNEIITSTPKEINHSQSCKTYNYQPELSEVYNLGDVCAKICFEQIDFLHRWNREWYKVNPTIDKTPTNSGKDFGRIERLLDKFDKRHLAKANFNCGEYARALMFLESYIEDNKSDRLQDSLSFLIEIYAELLDPDSVEGAVHMKKTSLTLPEQILVNNITDKPQENIACYEQIMIQPEQLQQEHVLGIVNSYLRLDLPETVLNITNGLWEKLNEKYTDNFFKECQAEPLLRLGSYDDIESLLEDPVLSKNPTNWNVQCAKAVRIFRALSITSTRFQTEIDDIRLNILSSLKTLGAEHNSYHKAYDEVLKLHFLSEIEKAKQLINFLLNEGNTENHIEAVDTFFEDWNARLHFLQPTVRILEPLLCLRRNLLTECKLRLSSEKQGLAEVLAPRIDSEIGKLWLQSIKIHREGGGLQQANLSIMKAEIYAPETLFIEKAKLLWQTGDHTKSLKVISDKISEIESAGPIRSQENSNRQLYSEAKFLQATYSAESMKICAEQNLLYFKQALEGNRNSEKCLVNMAQYLEKMYAALPDNEQNSEAGYGMLFEIMVHYARAMRAGSESMYQSMPRLLSIWFDFTSSESDPGTTKSAIQQMSAKMSELVAKCCGALPAYIFYSAYSQILSRICHPSQQVFEVLKSIVILLFETYPHQSLWMLLPVLKSSYPLRAKRCRLILNDNRLSKRETVKLIDDFNSLADKLIQLTTKEVAGMSGPDINVSTLVPKLPKLFNDPSFSQILLPFEKFMQVNAHGIGHNSSPEGKVANPFPNAPIHICGIKEDVLVLRSQAFPKRISLLCSDGREYMVMMKPKDDLRHDFRLMEFNALLKRYLYLDPQARQRRLHIRTYAAIPFNEDCGLIEWIPNLNAFRGIVMSIYKSRKIGIHDRELRPYLFTKDDKVEKRKHAFVNILLPRHPPVFHEWFTYQFCSPHNWYQARSSYIKTTAVMSMVGYILGLGDRHGENVLFDETNGDTVHVDFNCLFNKGETFPMPEKVPFRLTQNMVHAMGPLGVEGLYRKCCEITLNILQREKKTLLSVLRPFVYDLNRLARKTGTNIEKTDPQALENVNRIEERLHGYVQRKSTNRMPLSTEGQVDFLINEATDLDNLAIMYAGWGPYL